MLAPILLLVGDPRHTQRGSLKLREFGPGTNASSWSSCAVLTAPRALTWCGHPASDACVEAYAKGAIVVATFIAGVFAQGWIIGVVEVFEASRDGIAEAAFAVAADWRRQGVGSDLLAACRRWAEQSGIRTLRMVITRNNWPMRGLAHKAGARLDFDLDEIFADIAVATAAGLSSE